MSNENFFKHDDKAYAENLNDAILIANAFDYQVPVNIPGMYNNNHYPNDNNIHKVGVADVTIVSSGSLIIGDTSITNNSNTSQVLRLRVYPNFNSFYAWKRLNWTCTGDVTVNICDAGTSTSLLPSGALTNPDNETLLNGISNLQGLKEYDLLITIPVNGVLNTLSLVFVNNRNSQNRVSASINQSNVTGLGDRLTAIESKDTQQDGRLTALEEVDDGVFFYQVYASDYNPSIDSSVTVYCKCTDIAGSAVSGKSLTLYQNGTSVSSSITNENGIASWTVTCDDWGLQDFRVENTSIQVNVTGWREITAGTGRLWVNDETKTAVFYFTRTGAITSEISYANAIPSTYRPYDTVRMMGHNSASQVKVVIGQDGTVRLSGATSSTSITVSCQITYSYGVQ